MNLILFLFIFPIATIIFSIALQKILRHPLLVSGIILAIFLIVTFTVYGVNFLIAAFIYALISLITAYVVRFFCKIENRTIQINLINNEDNSNVQNCCINNESRSGENNWIRQNPDTRECRICDCQRQFRNCLREAENDNENNWCNCDNNQNPNTRECRICNCQRQFRNCLRR